jgi:hypothetical protein
MGFFDIIRTNPDVAVAACRRQTDDARAEIAAGEERLAAFTIEREEAIGDIDNAGYMKQVAAVDKKIEAESANIAACISRIVVLKQRLRSAEVAVLEVRKTDFIGRISKILPRRQRAATKIGAGIRLVVQGLADLEVADAALFAEPGFSTVRTLIPPTRFRANTVELMQLKNTNVIRSQFDAAAEIDRLNGRLIDLLQEGALPDPPSDDDNDEIVSLSPLPEEQQLEKISS